MIYWVTLASGVLCVATAAVAGFPIYAAFGGFGVGVAVSALLVRRIK